MAIAVTIIVTIAIATTPNTGVTGAVTVAMTIAAIVIVTIALTITPYIKTTDTVTNAASVFFLATYKLEQLSHCTLLVLGDLSGVPPPLP